MAAELLPVLYLNVYHPRRAASTFWPEAYASQRGVFSGVVDLAAVILVLVGIYAAMPVKIEEQRLKRLSGRLHCAGIR